MSTVYATHDPFSNRDVAIKIAHPRCVGESDRGDRFRKLFFNEAHATGVPDHPDIVQLYDAHTEANLFDFVARGHHFTALSAQARVSNSMASTMHLEVI